MNSHYPAPSHPRRLTRSRDDHYLGGVCGGLAAYLRIDPTLVRVLDVVLGFVTFPAGVIAYLVAWAIMPPE